MPYERLTTLGSGGGLVRPPTVMEQLLAAIEYLITQGVTVQAEDIEIGAVELKNASTDDRAAVSAAGKLSVVTASGDIPDLKDGSDSVASLLATIKTAVYGVDVSTGKASAAGAGADVDLTPPALTEKAIVTAIGGPLYFATGTAATSGDACVPENGMVSVRVVPATHLHLFVPVGTTYFVGYFKRT